MAIQDKYGNGKLGLYDPSLHIFVDSSEVRHMYSVHKVWAELNRRPEPVLWPERPGVGIGLGSVLYDPEYGKLRCWYFMFDPQGPQNRKFATCYAESADGIEWEKPELGIYEWEGSRENNICLTAQGMEPLDLNIPWVTRDESDPDPEARYKLIAYMQDERMYSQPELWAINHYLFTSPDGIHWKSPGRNINAESTSDRFWMARDQKRNLWVAAMGQATGNGEIRTVGLKTSADLQSWSKPVVPFKMDESEAYGWIWDHHSIIPFLYANQYLGYFDLHGYYALVRDELISSRDCVHWERPMRGIDFHRRGPEGTFDESIGSINPPVPVGDDLYFYYNATAGIGLRTMARDRFVGLECLTKFGKPACVLTEPVEVMGENLYLNVRTWSSTKMKVQVLSEDYKEVEGYEMEKCQPVTESGTRVKVDWEDKNGLKGLVGKNIVLRFEYNMARLYAYKFGD